MKGHFIAVLLLTLVLMGCNRNSKPKTTDRHDTAVTDQAAVSLQGESPGTAGEADILKEKAEIRKLIRQVLKWAWENPIDLLPAVEDESGEKYIALDLDKHRQNLDRLRETGYFAEEFISNYDHIILTLNDKFTEGQYGEWLVGDLPIFSFANGADPWCNCQDVPYDEPDPWDNVEISIGEYYGERAELYWKWGDIDPDANPGWFESTYLFHTVRQEGKWKISYMQGFDFEESTR